MTASRSRSIQHFTVFCLLLALLAVCAATGRAQSAANPGVVELDDKSRYTQVLALSDVHGMYGHLTTLLHAAKVINGNGRWTAGKTLLIVMGDSIDKGPESLAVLKLWMRLKDQAPGQGGQLIVLLGNHEAEFLKDPRRGKAAIFDAELTRAEFRPNNWPLEKIEWVSVTSSAPCPGRARWEVPLLTPGWYPQNVRWADFVAKSKRVLKAGLYEDALITGEHSILEEKQELRRAATSRRSGTTIPCSCKIWRHGSGISSYTA